MIYLLLIVYLFLEQIRSILRLKLHYFRQFWSWIDLGILVCSIGTISISLWKYQQSSHISERFQEMDKYISINNLSMYFLGFCCFFGTIKYVRLCRHSSRLLLFPQTLQHCRKDLLSFSLIFAIYFLAFVCLFHLLFLSKLQSCSSFFQTIRMLFEMILMQFPADELVQADAFLGPLALSLFVFLLIFVGLSMFMSIINEHFQVVRKETKDNQDDIYSFLWKQICKRIGQRDFDIFFCFKFEEIRRRNSKIEVRWFTTIQSNNFRRRSINY